MNHTNLIPVLKGPSRQSRLALERNHFFGAINRRRKLSGIWCRGGIYSRPHPGGDKPLPYVMRLLRRRLSGKGAVRGGSPFPVADSPETTPPVLGSNSRCLRPKACIRMPRQGNHLSCAEPLVTTHPAEKMTISSTIAPTALPHTNGLMYSFFI